MRLALRLSALRRLRLLWIADRRFKLCEGGAEGEEAGAEGESVIFDGAAEEGRQGGELLVGEVDRWHGPSGGPTPALNAKTLDLAVFRRRGEKKFGF